MYRVTRTIVKQNKHPELYQYLVENGILATSLYNASLFRIRQNFTMHGKDVLHPLEQEVQEEIQRTISAKHLGVPKRCMSYLFLEKLMRTTGNPDFFSKLPAHATQHVVKQACADFRNWLKACRSYKKDPSKFLGRPKMPGYKKKKVPSSYTFSNQECYVTETEQGGLLEIPVITKLSAPSRKNRWQAVNWKMALLVVLILA